MRPRRYSGQECGFTLIELMIVILVILILAAILIPQFGLARERALKASCISNQRNIETAVALWHIDHSASNYVQGTLATSTPGFSDLTTSPAYIVTTAFVEPDHAASNNGADYFLYAGSNNGGTNSPEFGHVACAYDGVSDPWVDNQDSVGAGTGLDHRRSPAYSP